MLFLWHSEKAFSPLLLLPPLPRRGHRQDAVALLDVSSAANGAARLVSQSSFASWGLQGRGWTSSTPQKHHACPTSQQDQGASAWGAGLRSHSPMQEVSALICFSCLVFLSLCPSRADILKSALTDSYTATVACNTPCVGLLLAFFLLDLITMLLN